MEISKEDKFQFAIDRGGTFTDIYARCPGGKEVVLKLLSEDPLRYSDAPREGIRRILEQELGKHFPIAEPLDTSKIDFIRMGTTVATNALLERKGERIALVITEGFSDLLYIGNQSRPKIFDLKIELPEVLYEEVVEVSERMVPFQQSCKMNIESTVYEGSTKEKLMRMKKMNEEKLFRDLQIVHNKGIRSLAVVLMHSYTYPEHELRIKEIALKMGFTQVSLSTEVMPMVKIVPRGYTACVDAYLTPCIQTYLKNFKSGFDKKLNKVNLLFMQSDGGLTPINKFNGSRAILSGPAGGVVGYGVTTYNPLDKVPVIGFDMGGTSTDVSRFDGQYEHVFETTTAGVTIQAPQLDINTVAAGGGSMLFYRSGLFVVGPESAGAHPGPTCYKKGGPLTVTDANLCLGRLLPDFFPKIFGPNEDEPLDYKVTRIAFKDLTKSVNQYMASQNAHHVDYTIEDVAMGFIKVANEAMCRPIRALTEAKGYDVSRHVLACFGGAGGQHACSIARMLQMKRVFIHKYSGILSAYGMALADVVHEEQEPCACIYKKDNMNHIDNRIDALMKKCKLDLEAQGFDSAHQSMEVYLNMRYDRTDCALMCTGIPVKFIDRNSIVSKFGDFLSVFNKKYKTEFGFDIPNRAIIVDDIRVRGIGSLEKINHSTSLSTSNVSVDKPRSITVTKCYFEGGTRCTPVYNLEHLIAGHVVEGPAIIINNNSTILIEPFCTAVITDQGNIDITVTIGERKNIGSEMDPIQLSIFSHRFMSIAEQMGRVLQRTAISTNIKERLDFSCALFGPDGGLVSNAPHIPVHLGAMQEAVKYQIRVLGSKLKDGDCILSNHPVSGGSHLPDLTVITPVFTEGGKTPIFFLANRGHHADIGGSTPGSMPPNSNHIQQEGAVFKSFLLVENGAFREKEVTEELQAPRKYPGCSGTRNLHDNLADLRAQVAANNKGISLVLDLIASYGLGVVQAYMRHIQDNAEVAVRNLLKSVAFVHSQASSGKHVTIRGEDFMDDGSKICLSVKINQEQGTAVFDFTGTSPMVANNLNAPRAICYSAIIYCLRSMVGYDIPLNQGCLTPVEIIIPKWSLLDPEENAAVVGGNVTTSQRIVDVIMQAFKACAASQGCMNNITFGDEQVGYYETVAGGCGAGPSWHGQSGIHSHMTNTRITDPEILELRYPCILNKFHLNKGTGGKGKFKGGDGIIREIIFRKQMQLSVLTERRIFSPYGLNGGEAGKTGSNMLVRANGGPLVNLGGKNSVKVQAGDLFRLQTPGGGGYGRAEDKSETEVKRRKLSHVNRGSLYDYTSKQHSH